MGDRTYVELTIQKENEEETLAIAESDGWNTKYLDKKPTKNLIRIGFDEVNYGELNFLSKLENAGIAYTSSWGDGDEYVSGEQHGRYNKNGELKKLEVYNDDYKICPVKLNEIICKRCSDGLKVYLIKDLLKQHKNETIPLPWDDQLQYAKIFKTKQLLLT